MYTITPTLGQLRIREICLEYENEYQELKPQGDHGNWDPLAKTITGRFSKEPIIVSDRVTGQYLQSSLPRRYRIFRLKCASRYNTKEIPLADYQGEIAFSRFDYINANSDEPAFTGGIKRDTTIRALLSIAFEDSSFELPLDTEVTYLTESKIFYPHSGSSHRTLACVLWGKLALDTTKITVICETAPDDYALFRAAQVMDKLQYIRNTSPFSYPEIDQIKQHEQFLLSLDDIEIDQIKTHLQKLIEINFDLMVKIFEQYREIKRNKIHLIRWYKTVNLPELHRIWINKLLESDKNRSQNKF